LVGRGATVTDQRFRRTGRVSRRWRIDDKPTRSWPSEAFPFRHSLAGAAYQPSLNRRVKPALSLQATAIRQPIRSLAVLAGTPVSFPPVAGRCLAKRAPHADRLDLSAGPTTIRGASKNPAGPARNLVKRHWPLAVRFSLKIFPRRSRKEAYEYWSLTHLLAAVPMRPASSGEFSSSTIALATSEGL
jgi:hypothetical protein